MRLPARLRRCAVWLLLPGLLLRALVAPGFMPAFGPDRVPSMQVCHGHASAASLPAHEAPAHPVDSSESPAPGPCAYAASATFVDAQVDLPDVASWWVPLGAPEATPVASVPERRAPRQFPPRGPPLLQA